MRLATASWALLGLLSVGALAEACSSEATTKYGTTQGFPTMISAGGGAPTSTTPSSSADAGAPGSTASGVSTSPKDGGAAANPDAGCAVSWSKDIYPALTGRWTCSNGVTCHSTGGNLPLIDLNDAQGVYTGFVAFGPAQGAPGKPFLLPGNTDPTQSSFLCSVDPTNTCGILMPAGDTATTTPVTSADITAITTWVTCGAPEN